MSLERAFKKLMEAVSYSDDYADIVAEYLASSFKKMASMLTAITDVQDFIDFSVSEIGEKETIKLLKMFFKYKK